MPVSAPWRQPKRKPSVTSTQGHSALTKVVAPSGSGRSKAGSKKNREKMEEIGKKKGNRTPWFGGGRNPNAMTPFNDVNLE